MSKFVAIFFLIGFLAIAKIGHTAPGVLPKAKKLLTLEQAFKENLAQQLALQTGFAAGEFTIEFENFTVEPKLQGTERFQSVQVLGLYGKRLDGLFQFPLVAQNGQLNQTYQSSGILKIIGPLFVAKRSMLRGEVVHREDLQVVQMPWRTLATGAAGVSEKELVGLRVKAHVERGAAVYPLLLDEPFAVRAGEMVELTLFSGPGVLIRSRAVAKSEGHIGDTIRIEQPDTKKVLSGEITDAKSVEVRL